MLVFEKTKDHTKLGVMGNIDDIACDLLICIALTHNAVKEKDEGAAKVLRNGIEEFCTHGTKANETLFEHFGDAEWMDTVTKEECEKRDESKQKLLDTLQELIDKIQGTADD